MTNIHHLISKLSSCAINFAVCMMINFSRLNRFPNFFQNWLCTGKWVRRLKSWFKYNDLDLQHCLVHIIAWYSVQRTCGVEFSQIFLGQHHQVGIVRPATVPIIFYSRFFEGLIQEVGFCNHVIMQEKRVDLNQVYFSRFTFKRKLEVKYILFSNLFFFQNSKKDFCLRKGF